MKTLIICFSQTGNTMKVAECIRDGIQEATGSCELVDVDPDSMNYDDPLYRQRLRDVEEES